MTEFEIFRSCFPSLEISDGDFASLTHGEKFTADDAFAVVSGDRIALICVSPEKQRRGVGSTLLKQCEEYIARNHSAVHIGGELICGAVSESAGFFAKHGYTLGSEYCEMYIDLADYSDPLPQAPAKFGFLSGRHDELLAAVGSVDEEWVQFFDGMDYFCGFGDNDEIFSFCIFEDDVRCVISPENVRTGSVGCVGTVPAARGKGVGLKMVSLALEELKRRGCGRCFIHWTHLDKWYGKLGAEVAFRFRPAEKML